MLSRAASHNSKTRGVTLAALALLLLSGCSGGGLKSAFRGEPQAPAAYVSPKPSGPVPMDAFRALAPPEGMKFTQLFAEPVPDAETRFARLEYAVQQTRNDFDTVVPSLVRLVAVEKDMKDLINQMNAMTSAPTAAAMPVYAAAPAQEVPQQLVPVQQAAPPAQVPVAAGLPSGSAVRAVRIGDHGDKTRIVLDLTGKPNYTASMDKDDRQLVLSLPGIGWTIQQSWQAKGGDLVSGYSYANNSVYIDLMSKSRIRTQDIIPGEGGRGYRLVIDLVRVNPL